jgi:hypothetical protein
VQSTVMQGEGRYDAMAADPQPLLASKRPKEAASPAPTLSAAEMAPRET